MKTRTLAVGRSATIGPCLDASVRRELAKDLGKFLPGTHEQQAFFVDEAERAIDRYRKYTAQVTASENKFSYRDQLSFLIAASESYAKAVARLSPETRDVILSEYFIMSHSGPNSHRAFSGSVEAMRRFDQSADEAQAAADIARKLRKSVSGRVGRGKASKAKPDAAIIGDLADAYMKAFGQRPSAEDESIFSRAVQEVGTHIPEAGLSKLGHTRLKRIIGLVGKGVAAPKRGRKRKALSAV